MNGNITKEGITLDLEAMQRVGIGGVFNIDAGAGIPKGPAPYLSAEWLQLKKHAMQEIERLGLEFTLHNCPGWSATGGPWITPALAMQQVTWSEAYVSGGQQTNFTLPKPFNRLNYYRDVAVLAFPSLRGEAPLQTFRALTANGAIERKQLNGEDAQGIVVGPVQNGHPAYLQFEFIQPYEARSVTFLISSVTSALTGSEQNLQSERTSVKLEASDDGIQFRLVASINTGLEAELSAGDKLITYDIPVTTAKYFRLSSLQARRYKQVRFSGITRLNSWMEKANYRSMYSGEGMSSVLSHNVQQASADSILNTNSILDITQYMDNEGRLQWTAPPGDWTILRMGFTPVGTLNNGAPDNGLGLECDKFSRLAFDFHFHKMMENLLPLLKPLIAKGKAGVEIESYEAGMQNWTSLLPQAFQKYRGYNIFKYLPALTGRIVNSVNITERFLWDFRRTQSDLMAENYYGRFDELCRQHGLVSSIQPYDRGPMEEMQVGLKVDENISECWIGLFSLFQMNRFMHRTPKLVASLAHIKGQKLVGAEAFTAEPESGRWQEYPFAMKAVGDMAFTKGINKMTVHRYAHQPHPSASPGMTMGSWGIHFDRTNTWWEQGKVWLAYLARCQSLLQQGLFVADLAYFSGEDSNIYTKVNPNELQPTPPEGYDYDMLNAEVILKNVRIEDKSIRLSSGMKYRALVLQEYKAISLPLLNKLRDLVEQGMVLVGARPERSLGLSDYTDEDAEFNQIANQLWGSLKGQTITEHVFGKGGVFWGVSLQSVLQRLNVQPDFEFSSRSGDAPVTYIHRRNGDTDIYFIANQRRTYEELVCTFRVNNRQPELWDAANGKMTTAPVYERFDSRIRMPLQLEPYGSVFVVFRSPAAARSLCAVEKDNTPVLSTKPFAPSSRRLFKDVTSNFTIALWAKPEMNAMLGFNGILGGVKNPWTDYYAIYPPSGQFLYGEGHATAGLAIGRNGVAVWEHGTGEPALVLAAPTIISGWGHIVLVYKDGAPSVYVNGKLIEQGRNQGKIVHPGLGEAYLSEGASYYNGDKSEPILFTEVLSEERIRQLAAEEPPVTPIAPFVAGVSQNKKSALLFRQNGIYKLCNSAGQTTSLRVSNIDEPLVLTGPWHVRFQPHRGAPPQIVLPTLKSLHMHDEDGVKYFSGTATYAHRFDLQATTVFASGKRFFIDLGGVEVIAEVRMNGRDLGIWWKRPYCADVTDFIKKGTNDIEIKVTNLWPNRLVGDEQLPEPYRYAPGAGASGLESLMGGAMLQLPDWYQEGRPKPNDGRIAFTTWKHYTKDSPLLASGLIGPVRLLTAVEKIL